MDPRLVRRTTCARIPTPEGTFQLCHYLDERNQKEHLALVLGDVGARPSVLVRVHSECFTGDVLGSQRCDCGDQLHQAMRLIAAEGAGVILYLRQEGRGIGLEQKLRAYNLQDQGYDTVDANLLLGHQADEREYSAAAAILHELGVVSIRLMTNNPTKIDHLVNLGIQIDGRVPLPPAITTDNAAYLATKVARMRHLLDLPQLANGQAAGLAASDIAAATALENLKQRAIEYHSRHGRPYVTLSYAQSLDGSIGTRSGGRLRLSGPESLRVTHALRAAHDAILVGIGTVLADNPQLTVRFVEGNSPQPVVVDSHLRFPLDARLLANPKAPWIAHVDGADSPTAVLQARGAQLLPIPATSTGQVDLDALLSRLGDLGMRSVMVEGGAQIIASLLAQRLVNYTVITLAPRLLSGLRLPLQPSRSALDVYPECHTPVYTQAGADLMVWGELAWYSTSDAAPAFPVAYTPTLL